MAYKLRREDGELLCTFELRTHHKGNCRAEVRDHDGNWPDSVVIWYEVGKRWQILVAGASAERFINE